MFKYSGFQSSIKICLKFSIKTLFFRFLKKMLFLLRREIILIRVQHNMAYQYQRGKFRDPNYLVSVFAFRYNDIKRKGSHVKFCFFMLHPFILIRASILTWQDILCLPQREFELLSSFRSVKIRLRDIDILETFCFNFTFENFISKLKERKGL